MSSATKSPVDRTMDTIPDTGDSGRKSAMSSASNKDRREKEIEWNLDQTSAPPQGTTRDSTTGTDVVNNDMVRTKLMTEIKPVAADKCSWVDVDENKGMHV